MVHLRRTIILSLVRICYSTTTTTNNNNNQKLIGVSSMSFNKYPRKNQRPAQVNITGSLGVIYILHHNIVIEIDNLVYAINKIDQYVHGLLKRKRNHMMHIINIISKNITRKKMMVHSYPHHNEN